jgi:hypothetical protein
MFIKKLHMKKKEDYVVLGLGLTLLAVVFGISYFAFEASRPTETEPVPAPTSIPAPTQPKTFTDATNPLIEIDSAAQGRLLDKVNHRPSISNDDAFAKAKILAQLPAGRKSGILYETSNVRIDYVSSADLFQVEILTTDIPQAKAEADIWFRAQGASQQGICDYPVMFYLSWNIMNALRGSSVEFSPVGNGC